MRRLLTWVVLSVLAVPVAARADGSIQLDARAGVAKPFGDVGNGDALSDFIGWAFPLEAQLKFRVLKQLAIGAYGRYSPTSVASTCSGCTVNDYGFGGVVEYRFDEKLEGGPWLAVSAGYAALKSQVPDLSGVKLTRTVSGFDGAVSGGIDFELGGLTLGPYLQLSGGEYTKGSASGTSASIESKGWHGFFGGGVRLALLL